MAFKAFTPGVLTSSDVNTFLMRQAVITCTSSTRPASPSEGMTIYETDTDRYKTYSGSAWEDGFKSGQMITGTATIGSTGAGTDWAIGNGTIQNRYQKIGRMVFQEIVVTFGTTTTFGTKDLLLNFSPASVSPNDRNIGHLVCNDVSTANKWYGFAFQGQTTQAGLALLATTASPATGISITSTRPFTWVSTDSLAVQLFYEAAA